MGRVRGERGQKDEEPKSRRAERREAQRRARTVADAARTSRHDRAERSNRVLIVGSVIAVVIVAAGFIAFGWYQTQIKPLSKTVLRVEEIKVDLGHLERRMELELDTNPFFLQSADILITLPDNTLAALEAEAALLAGGAELDLVVTDEDVAEAIRTRGGLAGSVEASVFADEVRRQVSESGLKRGEYEQMIRAGVMEEKARGYFLFISPTAEPQVRAKIMTLETLEAADEALARLDAGDNFDDVAFDLSPAQETSEVDWTPRGVLFEDFEEFLFEAEPGAHSEVIPAGDFFIIELVERDDERDLDVDQRAQVAERELADWLIGLRGRLDIERDFTQDDAARALQDVL